jgi:excisionase family DNA binding protein
MNPCATCAASAAGKPTPVPSQHEKPTVTMHDSIQSGIDQTAASTVPLLLTVEAAARRLGIGRTAMYALVKTGDVESIRIGHLRRIPVDALHAFIESLRTRKDDEAAA